MIKFRNDQEAICALATAPGHGAIAVLRLSGEKTALIARNLAPFLPENLTSHKAYYGKIVDGLGEVIDDVLLTYFSKGKSFTGEETIEVSCHGSPAVIQQTLNRLIQLGARPADPGEFTYRAFVNNRIDLTQAEATLSLIQSQTALAAKLSVRQLKGELSTALLKIEENMMWALSRLEAEIDFAHEDIPLAETSEIAEHVSIARSMTEKLLSSYSAGRAAKDGIKAVLVGPPNAGKSSLFNALAEEDRAIVSEIPGTTRDVLELTIQHKGQSIHLVDTAGLRETTDTIEKIGVGKTQAAAVEADIVLAIHDSTDDENENFKSRYLSVNGNKSLVVKSKADLLPESMHASDANTLFVSAHTRHGIEDLKNRILESVPRYSETDGATVLMSRHYSALAKTKESLDRALAALEKKSSAEFIVLDLQEGLFSIFEILGKRFDDEILDKVFRDFCLGK